MVYLFFRQFDAVVFSFINGLPHTQTTNYLAVLFHHGTTGGLIYLPLALLLLSTKYRRLVWLTLTSGLFTFIINDLVLKPLIHRPRPFGVIANIIFIAPAPISASFPSGETAVAAAVITTCILYFSGWKKYFLWIWVVLVGMDRIYLGHHYPTDVIAGAAVGVAAAYLAQYIAKRKFPVLAVKNKTSI